MEPLCISSKEPSEGCCPLSGTKQQEGSAVEATEGDGEPSRETEELLAKIDPLAAEKKLLGEYKKPEVIPDPSDICAIQELPTESEEVSE
jgi:bromodomain-containing protein 8